MPTSDLTVPVPPSVRWLRWVAFAAAAALTASGEFELAGLAGWPVWVAWLLPVALDVYSFASFATRRRGDTLAALALMIATNTVYHLAATGLMPAGWLLVVMVAALPPVICWRVHRLGEATGDPEAAASAEPAPSRPLPDVPAARKPAPEVTERRKPEAAPARKPAAPEARKPAEAEVPPQVPAEAAERKRRPPAETRRLAEQYRAETPGITQKALAFRLGISDRQLRNVLAAA